jgi:segregation and condensation protein B
MNREEIKSALMSMMFVMGDPIEIKDAADVLGVEKSEIRDAMDEMAEEMDRPGSGIRIRRINKSYQMVSAPENQEYIKKLCTPVKMKKLSQAALEVLAIVAYKQPVTKGQIDVIRGVKCDRVLAGIEEKGLVKIVGRSDAIGRPYLYGTTDEFLKNFGFSSLKDLPEIGDPDDITSEDDSADQLAMDFHEEDDDAEGKEMGGDSTPEEDEEGSDDGADDDSPETPNLDK